MGQVQERNQEVWFLEKEEEIQCHLAWHGMITGILCEAILRDRAPYTYLLRQGEELHHYYCSFVREDGRFHHQPFIVEASRQAWFYLNFTHHNSETLEGLIPKILHCEKEKCLSLTKEEGARRFYPTYAT